MHERPQSGLCIHGHPKTARRNRETCKGCLEEVFGSGECRLRYGVFFLNDILLSCDSVSPCSLFATRKASSWVIHQPT